jgi:undecaprenyl pyrophosphate phosphatase UppP
MTLFQSVIHTLLATFASILPVGEGAHRELLPFLLDWPAPSAALKAAVSIGACSGVFLYFWHDWASMISQLLQVIFFRRRPRTMDERMPLFILFGSVPAVLGWFYLEPQVPTLWSNPMWIMATLAGGSLLLAWLERFSRKNRQIFDWDFKDATVVGLGQLALLVPGLGRNWGMMTLAFMRNHSRESVGKFALYLSAPVLLAFAIRDAREVQWGQSTADFDGTSWLIFGCCAVIALMTSLFSVNALYKSSKREGFAAWTRYRWLVCFVFGAKLLYNWWSGSAA